MKKLPIESAGYALLIEGFAEWLDVQGYSKGTLQGLPNAVREFLHYLEQEGCKRIDQLTSEHLRGYHAHITSRANERRGGGLSNSYIHQHVQALTKFLQYLHHRGVQDLPSLGIRLPKVERPPIVVLSKEDIAELFKACDPENGMDPGSSPGEAVRARDRAMLAVFYGCGLRRNEAANLRLDDIDLEKRTIKVRKGKNYKERLVPLSKASAQHIQEWIYDHRPLLIGTESGDALFIAANGKALTGGMLYHRLKVVQQNVESAELRAKVIGLHTLRHAIATHLLQAGMELQKIARFLGHSSMDSTQIYTHIATEEHGHVR
jgi:integrase/recombinase XerD